MLRTLSGNQLHPKVALAGTSVNITDIIVTPDMNIYRYIGTYGGTVYQWDAAGNEITTMNKALTLVNQIGVGGY